MTALVGLAGIVINASTGYFLVTHGARLASAITEFGVNHIPTIFNKTVWLAGKMSENLANSIATRGTILGKQLVNFGRNFTVFAGTHPIVGAVASLGISLLAFSVEVSMLQIGILRNWSFTRLLLSHIAAGALATGLLALAVKVGLLVGGLTFSGIITLTATAYAISFVSRLIFTLISCCCCCCTTNDIEVVNEKPAPQPPVPPPVQPPVPPPAPAPPPQTVFVFVTN